MVSGAALWCGIWWGTLVGGRQWWGTAIVWEATRYDGRQCPPNSSPNSPNLREELGPTHEQGKRVIFHQISLCCILLRHLLPNELVHASASKNLFTRKPQHLCHSAVMMEYSRRTSLKTDDQAWRDLLTSKRQNLSQQKLVSNHKCHPV